MTLSELDWKDVETLSGSALKDRIFSILQAAAYEVQRAELDDPVLLGVVPRIASIIQSSRELESFREALGALARSTGLWNYIDRETADYRDAVVADAVTSEELGGLTFHREQIAALNTLLAGNNLVLSAPTSFGKSLLIDALLASGRYRRVAIVLPTIALLDEFRRRIEGRFRSRFEVVMFQSQEVPQGGNVIFLGTQERLINRLDLGHLDLVVVDEFYKLDPTRHDERSAILNAAVYQLLRRAAQFFFLGPNIENVRSSSDNRWKFEFLHTRFSTVAVDTFDLTQIESKEDRLIVELKQPHNWPALVFVSSPDRANSLAQALSEQEEFASNEEFSIWLDDNFGPGWSLSTAVKAGIGVHHGRVPRSLASKLVRMFNDGSLPVLFCTSTLIEGVNTAAKSVLIYDKSISRRDYDFFTFSNIRGRAGRLGQHFVGSVYLFHSPPSEQTIDVEPTLFADLDNAPDELLVHLSDEDISPTVSSRVDDLASRLDLTSEQLRLITSVGFDTAVAIRRLTRERSRSDAEIHWHGSPNYHQILAVCQIICEARQARDFGVVSSAQLAVYILNLRMSRTMREFFHWHTNTYQGPPSLRDNVFKFLRSCEYGLPQLFSVVELFAKLADSATSYDLFVAELPRWFRPEVLKQLDEHGVPIQISERFLVRNDSLEGLRQRLINAANDRGSQLTTFERAWILEALGL